MYCSHAEPPCSSSLASFVTSAENGIGTSLNKVYQEIYSCRFQELFLQKYLWGRIHLSGDGKLIFYSPSKSAYNTLVSQGRQDVSSSWKLISTLKVHFAVTCWQLWKRRCSLLFNDCYVERDVFVDHCARLMIEYTDCQDDHNTRPIPVNAAYLGVFYGMILAFGYLVSRGRMVLLRKGVLRDDLGVWVFGFSRKVKANVDASINSRDGSTAKEVVLRDDLDVWVFGFSRKVGTCTVGDVTWNLGFRRIVVESDNVEAIRILQNKLHVLSNHALVISIWNLASHSWELNFNHVNCSTNSIVDRLVRLEREAVFEAWIFQEPLVEVVAAALQDMHVEV
ncbi:hypothetical protein V6N11_008149 [Hibiscus sabdariffa]|uniref:RNase H type-1 domain-containing protein n=1 Tax=Hibiscus sabdariffa TaxID=183260 RepID=A0ABR2PZS5_9ROSI